MTSLRRNETTDGETAIVAGSRVVMSPLTVAELQRAHRKALRERARLDVDDRSDDPKPLPAADPRDPRE